MKYFAQTNFRAFNSPNLIHVQHDNVQAVPQPKAEAFVSSACKRHHCRECYSLRCNCSCHYKGAMR